MYNQNSPAYDHSGHSPLYIKLYERLRQDIVSEVYPYGSRLPSKRTLADEANVSVITVAHAYALLVDEGYVESRERSGFYVIFKPADGFARSDAHPPLSTEQPSSHLTPRPSAAGHAFPFSVLCKTMRRVMSEYGDKIVEKSPNQGVDLLREALRHYLARNRKIHADIDQIVIGAGTEYLYSVIVALLGRQVTYALESPSYEKIEQIYRAAGASCDLLPLGEEGIQSPALERTKASVLHISPYRSYPTGVTATASKRFEYLRWAETGRRFIIEDDFESEFTISSKPAETLYALSRGQNVIYLNTFSQTISPALRAGYMVLPPSLVALFEERCGFYSCTVPTFEQYLLAELINGGDFERHINRVRRAKRKALGRDSKEPHTT